MSTSESEQPPSSALAEQAGLKLHAFSNLVSGSYYRRTEVPFGVALSEWRVLQAAIASPGISQAEVATTKALNVMTVSRAVSSLRRKGLADVRTDSEDRRRSLVFPTDLGRGVGSDIADRARTLYAHVFSVLSKDEVAMLDDLMDRVNSFMQTSELPEPTPATTDWAAAIADHQARQPSSKQSGAIS